MPESQQNCEGNTDSVRSVDAVIIGAGFAGLYMLHRLHQIGISAKILEVADGVGGTWYWNRYPGAHCDIESVQYSYSFSPELIQEWKWTERYASQPEILRYLNHVADKFDLRKDIQLNTRVTAATFDETASRWNLQTSNGERLSAKFCIMATGCLSKPKTPDIRGIGTFKGKMYSTCQWPHEGVDFTHRRVALFGTGSSGIQSTPMIAEQAAQLYVFQRTPAFSIPGHNAPLDPATEQLWKENYLERRGDANNQFFGTRIEGLTCDKSALEATPEERLKVYEARWSIGGLTYLFAFNDFLINKEANDTAAEFLRAKVRTIVKDPAVAETLTSQKYPVGTKRLCVDNRYYETFNRDNVTLVDLRKENIEVIAHGIKTSNVTYEVDDIVLATGFDAMTGALLSIDIQGRAGQTLREKWSAGPCTYLGLMSADFPNLFMITGPGSPSVLCNMAVSIEQHVEWIAECLDYMQKKDLDVIEPTIEAETAWGTHVNDIANATLLPCANSWYMGENVPGKPHVFMPFPGGFPMYDKKCQEVVANGYEGFDLTCHKVK